MKSRTRRVRIETSGGQAFNVPNDEEGRTFLRSMRRFINRPLWRFAARGRGPRLRPGDTHVSFSRSLGIPQHESKWIAVYLGGSAGWQGSFHSILTPSYRPGTITTTTVAAATPPGPKFTSQERDLLQKLLEAAEDGALITPDLEDDFYSVFQKLVDI